MSNSIEIEARWINLDPVAMIKKLESIGATKEGSYSFQEWVFAKPEWRTDNRRIRVRTDGKRTWLTYKSSKSWTIDGTQEFEVEVSSPETMVNIMRATDIPQVRHQEKKRETYRLDDVVFDIDFWPSIPMVFEIEGPSEEQVREGARLLGLSWDDAIFEDQAHVHKKFYGVDLFAMSEYCFKKE